MPNSLIKKAATKLKVSEKSLEKKWNDVKTKLQKDGKLKGDSLFKVATKIFMRKCGYTPANESVIIVVDLENIDEASVIKAAVNENASHTRMVVHEGHKYLVTFNESVPVALTEGVYYPSGTHPSETTYKYSAFDNKFESIDSLVWKVVSKLREKLPDSERWELSHDEMENQAWEIIEKHCGLKRKDFDDYSDDPSFYRVMMEDDYSGFHLLHAYQVVDAMSFFHAVWEYNKSLAVKMVKEGFMFNSHKHFKFSDIIK